MNTDLLRRVEERIVAGRLLQPGQKVLVAVSGGVDSMVLLDLLHRLAGAYRWDLTVAHFNHQLRGSASRADENLVRRAAAQRHLAFLSDRGSVRRFRQKTGLSLEMAARQLRYGFLTKAARDQGFSAIALAHHCDDQVELFFLRLLRGSSPAGLGGMKGTSPAPGAPEIQLIRPLLDCPKTELIAYARAQGLAFREDASNRSVRYPRNRVRQELLPLLRRKYQPALTRVILRLMDLLQEQSAVLTSLADQWRRSTRRRSFERLPKALQRVLIHAELVGQGIPAEAELIEKLRAKPQSPVSIGPGRWVRRNMDGSITLDCRQIPKEDGLPLEVSLGRQGQIVAGRTRLAWRIFRVRNPADHTRSRAFRECFDADQVGSRFRLRHGQPGDRFQPIGMPQTVRLQDLFVNLKVPRWERRERILAESVTGELFWVEGLRIGERFKVTPTTRRCLELTWQKSP